MRRAITATCARAWSPTRRPACHADPAVVRSALAAAIALVVIGCGERPGEPPSLDGVYRATISAEDLAAINAPDERAPNWGAWTLVLDRGRFAITQDAGDQGCAWAYGALGLGGRNVMRWTVIDAGAVPAGVASNQPGDRYRFGWIRYRDVLTLSTARGGVGRLLRCQAVAPDRADAGGERLSTRCPPPAVALKPTGAEHASPSPDAAIHLTADLIRTTPTTWQGSGRDDALGRGRLTDRRRRQLLERADPPPTDLRGALRRRRATRLRDQHHHTPSARPLPVARQRADHRDLPGPACAISASR